MKDALRWIALTLVLVLSCAGCGSGPNMPSGGSGAGSSSELPAHSSGSGSASSGVPTEEDTLLQATETAAGGSRSLRLEVWGKAQTDPQLYGVREIRIYDGETLVQTLSVQDAIDADGVDGIAPGYTETWDAGGGLLLTDMNFDGVADIGLPGWTPNNTLPYYYWLWDSEAGQFRYAFCLQGAEADSESREIRASYKFENGIYYTDIYCWDEAGVLQPVRRDVEDWTRGSQNQPLLESYEMNGGVWTLCPAAG